MDLPTAGGWVCCGSMYVWMVQSSSGVTGGSLRWFAGNLATWL